MAMSESSIDIMLVYLWYNLIICEQNFKLHTSDSFNFDYLTER